MASERCLAQVVEHSRRVRHIPDMCLVVADETHIKGDAMVRPHGRSLVGDPLEAHSPDPSAVERFSSTVAISSMRSIMELSVNETPPAQSCDDWLLFCTSLDRRINGYILGALWLDQPDHYVLTYDDASVRTALADGILTANGVCFVRFPPYSPMIWAVEPSLADYKRATRVIAYHHPDLPQRILHVVAFASIPLAVIQCHYREVRRELSRDLPEMTGAGMPQDGVLRPLPGVLGPP